MFFLRFALVCLLLISRRGGLGRASCK